ncbi:uncharacterized protein BDW43DRAFT_288045 [Aspergillus alliaceus]|uniref:uncharacterized protein n=1 Tax=Petromyces alliaceus TaxID=209559 RepID=UPI0012A5C6CD|nr:uncharacterized protein BDW43DRAFT_288045 [Aspergillus alliaceus]KAB8229454.1 hypothetical protein BDW43DRAFT_288045 [Aspergillus alliaceus]
MADASNRTSRGCLSQLPAELLYEVFQRCPDFSALWSLLNTSSRILAVFNTRAPEIVNAVLNSTVPVQTRVHMRQVLAIRTGTYSYSSYVQARRSRVDASQLCTKIISTPEQLRSFVKLAHKIHVLAHLCIDRCLQRCLESPLGLKEYPMGFRFPTWTEEQRTILSFWRVLFFNALKTEGHKGNLDWSPRELKKLRIHGPYQQFVPLTPIFQARTALRYIYEEINPEGSEDDFSRDTGQLFQLPKLPEAMEFGWTCQPPPSLWAVNQGWDPADPPTKWTRQISERRTPWDYDSDNEVRYRNRSSDQSEGEEPESNGRARNESESDESQRNELESSESESDESESDETDTARRPPSDPDIIPAMPLPIQYLELVPKGEEWRTLHGETIGVQFWRYMSGNPKAGPGQYIRSGAYLKYGFAIWEEQRMVDMGLWSIAALVDASDYLLKWYSFLSEDDIEWYDSRRRYPTLYI